MILLPQKIEVNWNSANIKHYTSLGHVFTKNHDRFTVNVLDLSRTSPKRVDCTCDYCGKKFSALFRLVNPNRQVSYKAELKDVCSSHTSCFSAKIKEICMEKYGVISPFCTETIKEKIRQTCLKKYGTKNTSKLHSIKKKMRQTCLKKYGTDYPLQNKCIREKSNQKIISNYGVNNVFQSDKIKEKSRQTNLKNIGVEYPAQSESIRKKQKHSLFIKYGVTNAGQINIETRIKKSRNTMYKNGTGPCSKQQKYLHILLGGELNYPIGRCLLDIAYPDQKVYIEYDGGGHTLFKGKNINEFYMKQRKREIFLRNKGWKIIRYITSKDILLKDVDLIFLLKKSKEYLKNHSWMEFNIDKGIVKCSGYEINLINFISEK